MAAERGILIRPAADYDRDLLAEGAAQYAALRADPVAWVEYCAELGMWDATIGDGLDADEHWTNDGEVRHG